MADCAGRIDTAAMVMLFPAGLNVFYSDPERHLPGKILRATDEIFPYNTSTSTRRPSLLASTYAISTVPCRVVDIPLLAALC